MANLNIKPGPFNIRLESDITIRFSNRFSLAQSGVLVKSTSATSVTGHPKYVLTLTFGAGQKTTSAMARETG